MQQEEEAKTHQGGNKSSPSQGQGGQQGQPGQPGSNTHHISKWKEETAGQEAGSDYGEYIDMEMEDECPSDVDSETWSDGTIRDSGQWGWNFTAGEDRGRYAFFIHNWES